jgi:hypothetical protein
MSASVADSIAALVSPLALLPGAAPKSAPPPARPSLRAVCCSHVGSARSKTGREEVAGGCRSYHVGHTCTREIGDSTWNPSISNIDLRCCTTRSPAAGFDQFFPSTVPTPEFGACWSYVSASACPPSSPRARACPNPHACIACAEKIGPPEKTSEARSDGCSFSREDTKSKQVGRHGPPTRPCAALRSCLLRAESRSRGGLWYFTDHFASRRLCGTYRNTICCPFTELFMTSS